jgi:AbrB family looped-hinge helix DNA binding protein
MFSKAMSVATLTSKGQVTIPSDVRARLRLQQGDRLEFTVQDDGSILVRPRRGDVRALFGMLKASRSVTVEDMNRTIQDAAAEGSGPARPFGPTSPGKQNSQEEAPT